MKNAKFKLGDSVRIISRPGGVNDQSIVGKIGVITKKENSTTFQIAVHYYPTFIYSLGDFENI